MEFANRDLQPGKVQRLLTQFAKIVGVGMLILFMMSFLFPACGCGGYDNARLASCESNMKQIGLALMQYSQDNDGALPSYAEASSTKTWREAIYPYTKATGLYQCPDDSRNGANWTPDNLPKSYAANTEIFSAPGAKRTNWPGAAATIAVVDSRGYSGGEWNIVSSAFLPTTGRTLYAHTHNHAFYEHPAKTINCLMGDGHVKSLLPEVMITPTNYWTHANTPFTGQALSNAQAILQGATTN